MKKSHLITVGKLNETHIKSLESEYLKRLSLFDLCIHETKSHALDQKKEALEVKDKIEEITRSDNAKIVLMMEEGKIFNSQSFAKWFGQELANSNLIFVIGGAHGHGPSVLELPHQKLSLSPLTFPHKLARLLLIEQLYRAQTILMNHPYNK